MHSVLTSTREYTTGLPSQPTRVSTPEPPPEVQHLYTLYSFIYLCRTATVHASAAGVSADPTPPRMLGSPAAADLEAPAGACHAVLPGGRVLLGCGFWDNSIRCLNHRNNSYPVLNPYETQIFHRHFRSRALVIHSKGLATRLRPSEKGVRTCIY